MVNATVITEEGRTESISGEMFLGFALTEGEESNMECKTLMLGEGNLLKVTATAVKALVRMVNTNAHNDLERLLLHAIIATELRKAVVEADDDPDDKDEEDALHETHKTVSAEQGTKKFHRGSRV